MKNCLLLLLLCLFISSSLQAKIRRVGFIATINRVETLDYLNFQAAHNASSTGDTIQLYPSTGGAATYSGSISKQLVIMGPGYFTNSYYLTTGEFANTDLQNMAGSVTSCNFTLDYGSAGTIIMGLNGITINTVNRAEAISNIIVTRCRNVNIGFDNTGNCDNWNISKCYGVTISQTGTGSSFTGDRTIDNLSIRNCVIFSSIALATSPQGTYANNTIYNCNFLSGYSLALSNAIFTVQNCIFQGQSFTGITNTSFKQNLTTVATSTTGVNNTAPNAGNQFSVNLANIYDGYPTNTNLSPDNRFRMKTGGTTATNPALQGGFLPGTSTPTQCGIYGGATGDPYVLSGIAPIPVYYQVTAPSAITSGTNYTITFSIRSNN
jgi:hypothetical protein